LLKLHYTDQAEESADVMSLNSTEGKQFRFFQFLITPIPSTAPAIGYTKYLI